MLKKVKQNIIEFKNVSFAYHKECKTFNNVSFEINKNDFVCIVGSNGSGKSTLVKLLSGLLKPTFGEIFFKKNLIGYNNYKLLSDNIAVVLDDPYQIIGQTPEEDIVFWLQNRQVSSQKIKNIISSIIKLMHLEKIIDQDFSKLSFGQKRLAILASVLVKNCEVLIFDEANLFLDNKSKDIFQDLVRMLWKKYKKTIIWVTHDLNETQDANKILLVDSHHVISFNNKEKFFNNFCFSKKKFDAPFLLKLSSKIKYIKPTCSLDELIKEISYVK